MRDGHDAASGGDALTDASEAELRRVVEGQRAEIEQLQRRVQELAGAADGAAHVLEGLVPEPAVGGALPALLRALTTPDDVRNVQSMCKVVAGGAWRALFDAFYEELVRGVDAIPDAVCESHLELRADWYEEPWYLMYVQYTGVSGDGCGDFDTLRGMLPYIRDHLNIRNVCLLPHYQSPMGDGGYDVSAYVARDDLGGEEAFARFMHDATQAGVRVVTDAVFNHTSTEHDWFQRALAGDEKYIAYYVQRNGREKISEWDRDGDIVCRYRDPDGTITDRVVVFPDIDRTHGLWVEINGKTYQFYRSFSPFQVDLNLQNPDVLREILRVLAGEVALGTLGKRMDAIAHWIKKPGSASEGLPECHALQALLKSFLRHLSPRAIVMPEIVRNMENTAEYAGMSTTINGVACASEGDALLAFDMQAALREMAYFQTVAPFWQRVFRNPRLPSSAVWVNLLEHHDETYMGFFAPEVRKWIGEYIKAHSGVIYKNGMSAGGRYADCLDGDPERIATSIFALYMCPGTPMLYAGVEIGAGNEPEHAKAQMTRSHSVFQKLGVYTPESACFDPRELQRGPVSRTVFDNVVSERYLPCELVRKLNCLRARHASLRAHDVHPIDSNDVGVLCMVRDAPGAVPLLCVANLTPLEKSVLLPARQLAQRLRVVIGGTASGTGSGFPSINLTDLLTGKTITAKREKVSFRFVLAKFGRMLLELQP